MRRGLNALIYNQTNTVKCYRNYIIQRRLERILSTWHSYADTRKAERAIVARFRQFHERLMVTKCLLAWIDETRIQSSSHSLVLSNC